MRKPEWMSDGFRAWQMNRNGRWFVRPEGRAPSIRRGPHLRRILRSFTRLVDGPI